MAAADDSGRQNCGTRIRQHSRYRAVIFGLIILPACTTDPTGDGEESNPPVTATPDTTADTTAPITPPSTSPPGTASPSSSPDPTESTSGTPTPPGDDDVSPTASAGTDTPLDVSPTPSPSLYCGTLDEDQVWTAQASPHIVTCDVMVEGLNAPILTIEAGAEIRFQGNSGLFVAIEHPGGILALGTEEFPIRMTFDRDPGLWTGVQIGSQALTGGAILRSLSLEDGGNVAGAALTVEGTEATLIDTEIRGWLGSGFNFSQASFTGDSRSLVVRANGGLSGYLDSNFVETLPSGTYSGNGTDGIEIRGGIIEHSTHWESPGVPFLVGTNLVVQGEDGPILTLSPGIELAFRSGFGLYVGNFWPGGLTALGHPDAPIVFTSAGDQLPGAWAGVRFGPQTVSEGSVLEEFVIEYGGGADFGANLVLLIASPTIRDCLLRFSSGYGLCADQESFPVLENVTYEGNVLGDVCP